MPAEVITGAEVIEGAEVMDGTKFTSCSNVLPPGFGPVAGSVTMGLQLGSAARATDPLLSFVRDVNAQTVVVCVSCEQMGCWRVWLFLCSCQFTYQCDAHAAVTECGHLLDARFHIVC